MAIAYGACLVVSAALLVYVALKGYTSVNADYWMIMVLMPVVIMGYWLKTQVETTEAAMVLFCFIYLDSTFLVTTALFAMMRVLGFQVRPWLKAAVYIAACIHIAIVCIGVHSNLYYESMAVVPTVLGSATKMTSGPLKLYHNIFVAALVAWFLGILVVRVVRRQAYSRRSFFLFSFLIGAAMAWYLIEGLIDADFSALPFLYVAGDAVIALNLDYAQSHDIGYVLSNQQKRSAAHGYVAISPDRRLQSHNSEAIDFLPFLKEQRVDDYIAGVDEDASMVLGLVDSCDEDGSASTYRQVGDRTYAYEVQPYSLKRNEEAQGYLVDIRDATEEVRNYQIVSEYNATLNAEVKEKTDSIREMQRKIVLGMANMIENRDNNTGGHVKRTSDVVRVLVDEIVRQGSIDLGGVDPEDVVRAAPTHDLGKITIDEGILNKPGRFTDEEYEIMKTHAAKSGEMVLILLGGVEEEQFVKVAFNVARYHHERWDGRGYPEGLVGTMIPLEARIMAVADVYDALVSKRVYKEPMSFDKAREIMVEGMGTQFDPNMKAVFLGCREQLEEYYRQQ